MGFVEILNVVFVFRKMQYHVPYIHNFILIIKSKLENNIFLRFVVGLYGFSMFIFN